MAQQHFEAKLAEINITNKPLVVLLKGPRKDSSMMEMILRTSGLATLRDQATLFVLSALDQATISMPPITESLRKAALPAISMTDLPVVLVLDASGKALAATRGLVTAGDLQQTLAQAVSKFQTGRAQDAPTVQSAASTQASQLPDAPAAEAQQPSQTPATPASADSRPTLPQQQPPTHAPTSPPAPLPAAAAQEEQPMPETFPVMDPNQPVQLQIYLPDGQALRSRFKGSSTLLEVLQYVSQHLPEAGTASYSIVSLHLGKEFADSDQHKSLAELGVQSQTSLRLRYKQRASGSSGGTFMEQLTHLLIKLNPVNLLQWIVNVLRPQSQASRQRKDKAASAQQGADTSGNTTGRQATVSQAARRKPAAPGRGRVHTVHDAEVDSDSDDPDGNKYWNGNSTQFDGKDE